MITSDGDNVFKDTDLQGLIKVLKANMSRARVGILGGQKNARDANRAPKSGQKINASKSSTFTGKVSFTTNASIGALHEFGSSTLPQRSFLRVPISTRLKKELEKSGAFNPDQLAKVLKEKSVIPWLKKIAVIGEKIVSDAFDTGGFGAWKPSNMSRKQVKQTLVETQQLRNSITSEVK